MYTKKDSQNNSTLPKVDDAQKTLERMYEDNVLKRLPANQPCASAAEALASIGPLSDEHTAALLKKKALQAKKKKNKKVKKKKEKKKKKKEKKKKKKKKKKKAESSSSSSDSSSSSSESSAPLPGLFKWEPQLLTEINF